MQTIEGIEIKTSWDEVTLAEFLPLSVIEADADLKETPLRRSLERIKVLTGKTEEEFITLPGATFGHLITASKFLDIEPITLFKESATFMIGEVEYGYRKPGDLNTGEYISLEMSIASAIKNKRSMLPDILAILIRPVVVVEGSEFGAKKQIEAFASDKFQQRIEFFKENLRVPFFIHALNRITVGAHGIKNVTKNFIPKANTTKQGKRSKRK